MANFRANFDFYFESIKKKIKTVCEDLYVNLPTERIDHKSKNEKMAEINRRRNLELINNDMICGKYGEWKFYLANPDGTYTDALSYDEAMAFYKEGQLLTPKIANAIVVTSGPFNFIVRKGLEDYAGRGVVFSEKELYVLPPYRIPLDGPEAEQRATTIPELEPEFEQRATTIPESEPEFEQRATTIPELEPEFEQRATTIPESKPEFEPELENKPDLFIIDDNVLVAYTGYKEEKVIIPNGVTQIGQRAFLVKSLGSSYSGYVSSNFDFLKEVIIPDSVIEIENEAFKGRVGLISVKMSNSITSIGDEAFKYCENLEAIEIPSSVTSIGDYAFCGCYNLKSIKLPNSIKKIKNGTFFGCSSLSSVSLPESLKEICYVAFEHCSALTEITIPASVNKINGNSFSKCKNLRFIYYPCSKEKAEQIGLNAIPLFNENVIIRYNYTGK